MSRGRCFVQLINGKPVRIFRSAGSAALAQYHSDIEIAEWPRKDAVGEIRNLVFDLSEGQCKYCGMLITRNSFHMHEVKPRGNGGEVSIYNSVAICSGCHIIRTDSEHGNRRPLFGAGD